MFRPLGAEGNEEVLKKREEKKLFSKKIEELSKENELLKKRIEELLAKFQQELAERERKAFEKGLKTGREEVLKNFGKLLEKLEKVSQEAKISSDEALHRVRELIIEIVFEIVDKLLPEIRKDSLNVALTSVKEIVSSFLTASPGVKLVYLSPEDFKELEKLIQSQPELNKLAESFQLVFEPDPELAPGDVVVKTEAIDVDGCLRTKLEELKNYLRENFNV
jgi:flagellar biosynthesis/type III secretory pathway protein FliH